MAKERRKSAETPKDAKKLKKTEATPPPKTKSTKDILKDATEFEDQEALQESGEKDLQLFQETTAELRETVNNILALKLKGKDSKIKEEIEEKKKVGALKFITLKKLNRLDKLRLKKSRDMTNEAKHRVDTFHLQLDNLLYEVVHLQKEVQKCLEFKSKDEEIELIPVDEFIKQAGLSSAELESLQNDKHKMMLARLQWEYEQRKKLSDQVRQLEKSKQDVHNQSVAKQKVLENLEPKLNTLLEAAKPLQDDLKTPFEQSKRDKLSLLLPAPLYVLYSQLRAYGEACDPSLQVSVEGDEEKARDFHLNEKKSAAQAEENPEEPDSDSDTEAETRGKRKRSVSTAINNIEKSKDIFQKHPLQVRLKLSHSEKERVLMDFSYLTTLNIVTVLCQLSSSSASSGMSNVLQADTLLRGLFPGDDGDKSPNEANFYQFPRSSTMDFHSMVSDSGRPFVWAQQLAGLDFSRVSGRSETETKVEASASVSSTYVEKVVKRLKERLEARANLQKIVSSLERGIVPLSKKELTQYPSIDSCLVSWTPSDWDEYVKNLATENFVETEFVTEESHFFHNAVIERGSARLKASVAIPLDYPTNSPVFCLHLSWHGNRGAMESEEIRSMEAEVNVHLPAELKPKIQNLLAHQIQRLCVNLDLLTDVDGVLMSKNGGSYQDENRDSKPEFPREKIFHKPVSGRTRDYPFYYNSKTELFQQR